MKKMWMVLASVVAVLMFVSITTVKVQACCDQDQCVCEFVDVDGDGICDLCGGCLPQGDDDDGDGIPNGQDDDYVPPQDGTGNQKGRV